ncbi:MAG: hypothetical protein M3525_08160 [Acidobacteriota bacterium]|nr:hypothetical protein [Acidobacteriota bacterium]
MVGGEFVRNPFVCAYKDRKKFAWKLFEKQEVEREFLPISADLHDFFNSIRVNPLNPCFSMFYFFDFSNGFLSAQNKPL